MFRMPQMRKCCWFMQIWMEKPRAFIVPGMPKALAVGERQKTLVFMPIPSIHLKLDNVKIPADQQLGGTEGHSMDAIQASWQIALASLAAGSGSGCL